jgi:hypothetical protein
MMFQHRTGEGFYLAESYCFPTNRIPCHAGSFNATALGKKFHRLPFKNLRMLLIAKDSNSLLGGSGLSLRPRGQTPNFSL